MNEVFERAFHPMIGDIPDQLFPALGGPPPDDRMILQHVDLTLPGLCAQGATFGRFIVPSGYDIRITKIEVFLQTAPQDDVTFDLMVGNARANLPITVLAHTQAAILDISQYNGGVQINHGSVIGGIVTASGEVDYCGEFATVRICYNII